MNNKKLRTANTNITLAYIILSIGAVFIIFALLSGGISFVGIIGVFIGYRFLVKSKDYKKQLEEDI
ncbi:hypothetical protein [uncultured Psychroserpens sp.]|uniref:hypothetical protein n=1 Tax=uncultured Psychroserpens sp. TaxID=255436 RepID=UPI00261959DA|nr:hypothetical protein [uncultured Psychroserpens sp.]